MDTVLHAIFLKIDGQPFDLGWLEEHHDFEVLAKVYIFSREVADSWIFGEFILRIGGLIFMEGKIVMAWIIIGIEGSEANGLPSVHDYQRL